MRLPASMAREMRKWAVSVGRLGDGPVAREVSLLMAHDNRARERIVPTTDGDVTERYETAAGPVVERTAAGPVVERDVHVERPAYVDRRTVVEPDYVVDPAYAPPAVVEPRVYVPLGHQVNR